MVDTDNAQGGRFDGPCASLHGAQELAGQFRLSVSPCSKSSSTARRSMPAISRTALRTFVPDNPSNSARTYAPGASGFLLDRV